MIMESHEFLFFRKKLKKTQQEMAELLSISVNAVRSYEQGWRSVPAHAERQLYFLLSREPGTISKRKPCWVVKKCPPERKKNCPAWEFNAGSFCWFINGTICECKARKTWKDKMVICRQCEVLASLYEPNKEVDESPAAE